MLERPARRKGIANLARKVTLSEIRIGKRYRREMGDIGGLAASMEELGLLQPIVVTPDGTLIAGERRLRAALRLGWTHISISVVDIDAIVREASLLRTHIVRTLRSLKRSPSSGHWSRSSERPSSSGRACAGADIPEKFSTSSNGRALDKVAAVVGVHRTTIAKAEAIVDAAEAEPDQFGKLLAEAWTGPGRDRPPSCRSAAVDALNGPRTLRW